MRALPDLQRDNRAVWLVVLALILLGLNLRPILASVGPLLDEIQLSTGISSGHAGLLTTLPVLAMGLCALAGNALQRLFGQFAGVLLGVAVIALACAARGIWHDGSGLIITAAIGGLGIALVQALLPAFIKEHFAAHVGVLMGLYTTGIMGGAAIAAATVSPLASVLDWYGSLAIWAVPALLAAGLWLAVGRVPSAHQASTPLRLPVKVVRAWTLMVFFGIATAAYTLVLAWLPPFYTKLGMSATESGLLLGLVTVSEVASGLLVSAFVGRFHSRRVLLQASLLLQLLGLLCLIFSPLELAIVAAVLLGLGIGALFPLSLITSMDHTDSPQQAGALMSMVQGGGYIIASLMPLLAGLIRQRFADLTLAWIVMLAGVVLMMLMAMRFTPGRKLKFD